MRVFSSSSSPYRHRSCRRHYFPPDAANTKDAYSAHYGEAFKKSRRLLGDLNRTGYAPTMGFSVKSVKEVSGEKFIMPVFIEEANCRVELYLHEYGGSTVGSGARGRIKGARICVNRGGGMGGCCEGGNRRVDCGELWEGAVEARGVTDFGDGCF